MHRLSAAIRHPRPAIVRSAGLLLLSGLLTTSSLSADRVVFEETFSGGTTAGWSGTGSSHNGLVGDRTPNGAFWSQAFGPHLINSPCIELDAEPFHTSVLSVDSSIQQSSSSGTLLQLAVVWYDEVGCTSLEGSELELVSNLNLPEDSWVRTSYGDIIIPVAARSARLRYQVDGVSFFSTYLDDVSVRNEAGRELVPNPRFLVGGDWEATSAGWSRLVADGYLGDPFYASVLTGNLTFAVLTSACIDITEFDAPETEQFELFAAVRPNGNQPEDVEVILSAQLYDTSVCDEFPFSSRSITTALPRNGNWGLLFNGFTVTSSTRAMKVAIRVNYLSATNVDFNTDTISLSAIPPIFEDGFESGNTSSWN